MPTSATSSQGSTIEVNINGTMASIPYVLGFTGPDPSKSYEDITNLDSTGAFMEWIPSLKDAGSLPFECIAKSNDSTHKYMVTSAHSDTLEQFRINVNLVDVKSYTFHGYTTKFSPKAEAGKALRYSAEIRISGAINRA